MTESPHKKISRSFPFYLIKRGFSSLDIMVKWKELASIQRLYNLKNTFKHKRCFILGNGPSLANTDLSLLRNEYTFGSNRIYMLFDKIGFETSFYLAIDSQIMKQYYEDINRIKNQKFILNRKGMKVDFSRNTILLRDQSAVSFWSNPFDKFFLGGSVTYVAMQLAYFMGFNPVILVGVDHSYTITRDPGEKVVLQAYHEGNGQHFSTQYYREGDLWIPPEVDRIELAYRIARYVYARSGRSILDATIGGKLDLFPKVDYQTLF